MADLKRIQGSKTRRGRRGQRTEKRKEQRRRKRRERKRRKPKENKKKLKLKVITRNIQGMTMSDRNRNRLRTTAAYIKDEKWEIALVSAITGASEGVVWLGGRRILMVGIHSREAAIALRGEVLEERSKTGQKKWFTDRTVAIKLGNLRLAVVYKTHSAHNNNDAGMESYRKEVEDQIGRRDQREVLVVDGDHNAHIRRKKISKNSKGKIWFK